MSAARHFATCLSDFERQCAESPVARMIAIQMEAYPSDWPISDKIEMAKHHLGMAEGEMGERNGL